MQYSTHKILKRDFVYNAYSNQLKHLKLQTILNDRHKYLNAVGALKPYTGLHKKTGTFEKPNKNWRNPKKKNLLAEIEPLQLAF